MIGALICLLLLQFNKLMSVFLHLSSLMVNCVITLSNSCVASGSTTNFDNVLTKFITNRRMGTQKTDINLFFTIQKGQN